MHCNFRAVLILCLVCFNCIFNFLAAQGLDFLPPVLADSGGKGTFILSTADFGKITNGGNNQFANSVQIIDAANPWPPIWFTSAAPCGYNQVQNNVAFNWFMDASVQDGYISFYKEQSVISREMNHPHKQGLVAGYIICAGNLSAIDTFSSTTMPINFHAFAVNSKREKLGMLQLDTVLNMAEAWNSATDTMDLALLDIIEVVDSNNKVVFKWNPVAALGVGAVDRQYAHEPSATVPPGILDWSHGNALSWDYDGNILYSFRHIGVGKISSADGHVMWHLEGKKMYTDKRGDTIAFYLQHDFKKVRQMKDAEVYSLYSNGDKGHPQPYVLQFTVNSKSKTNEVGFERKIFPHKKIRSSGSGNYDVNANDNYLFNYGVTVGDTLNDFHVFMEEGDDKMQAITNYYLPKDVYSYKAHWLDGTSIPRPSIKNTDGVLSAIGNANNCIWYQLAGDNNTVAVKVGVGGEFKPLRSGAYCLAREYGVGYAVSRPVIFRK